MNAPPLLCPVCHGSRWLCEAHVPLRWRHDDCGAAGVPCVCRRGAARWMRRVGSVRAASAREVERRSGDRFNRRLLERRAQGVAGVMSMDRRTGERRRHERRVAPG